MNTKLNAQEFSDQLSDAYSTDNYKGNWVPCIKMLRKRGYDDQQVEAIIRSKWTRWAADSSNKAYGHANSADLSRYLENVTLAEVNDLVKGTF